MKTKTITAVILLVLATTCFGQVKTPPITIDCTFTRHVEDFPSSYKYSKTKVAPENVVFLRPGIDPRDGPNQGFVVLGRGFGHLTKQTDQRALDVKLRKVASEHGANAIAYEISGDQFRVQFLRIQDAILKAASRQ
jgi:hypothetical protein